MKLPCCLRKTKSILPLDSEKEKIVNYRFKQARNFLATISIAAATVFATLPAQAAKYTRDQLNAVQLITTYFNNIRSMKGEFTQIGPRGRVSSGIFYIVKPGRMRFEYAPPNPLIVVSDGTWVTVKNRRRKKADQYPLTSTPLRIILDNKVNLFKETKIQSVQQSPELATITLKDTSAFASGSLVLVYDKKAKVLQQWIVVDERGRRTVVTLSNIERNVSADPKLFKIKIPKSKRQRQLEEDSR
jgi:outer membrane lipoprotein-sorting protein